MVGLAIGCELFVELNPFEGDHEYELPIMEGVPINADVVMQLTV